MSQIILRDLYCEKCTLQFDKKYVFDLHMDLVHGEEIKVKKEQLIKEEKFEELQQSEKELSYPITHVMDKSFQCDKCDSFFKSKQNLKRHMESVHEGKKPFLCSTL